MFLQLSSFFQLPRVLTGPIRSNLPAYGWKWTKERLPIGVLLNRLLAGDLTGVLSMDRCTRLAGFGVIMVSASTCNPIFLVRITRKAPFLITPPLIMGARHFSLRPWRRWFVLKNPAEKAVHLGWLYGRLLYVSVGAIWMGVIKTNFRGRTKLRSIPKCGKKKTWYPNINIPKT